MRVIERKMLRAFKEGKKLTSGNDRVYPTSGNGQNAMRYRLYDTEIITVIREDNEIIINCGGWDTPTTKSRINSFFQFYKIPARVFTAKKQLKLSLPSGKTIDWDGWGINIFS